MISEECQRRRVCPLPGFLGKYAERVESRVDGMNLVPTCSAAVAPYRRFRRLLTTILFTVWGHGWVRCLAFFFVKQRAICCWPHPEPVRVFLAAAF